MNTLIRRWSLISQYNVAADRIPEDGTGKNIGWEVRL